MKALQFILITLTATFLSACTSNRESSRDNSLSIELDGYMQSCDWNPVVSVNENGTWRERGNPFNSFRTPLCYLDDQFQPVGMCDLSTCQKIRTLSLGLVEYVQVGLKRPPRDAGAGNELLPMYKTVPLNGEIKVRFNYFADSTCSIVKTFTATFSR